MQFYRNNSTDPAGNIALEESIFESFTGDDEFFMLWRNDKSVIVGSNQVIENEVDLEFAEANGITVVRRKTGGGAVYHDLGNVNYTYISKNADRFGDFLFFAQPVIDFLRSMGLDGKSENTGGAYAQHIGKNDIGICDNGTVKKISGNAQRVRGEHILHHGTLMFNVDISILERVLTPDPAKFTGKGIQSVRSRVCNISDYLHITNDEFWDCICTYFGADDSTQRLLLPYLEHILPI